MKAVLQVDRLKGWVTGRFQAMGHNWILLVQLRLQLPPLAVLDARQLGGFHPGFDGAGRGVPVQLRPRLFGLDLRLRVGVLNEEEAHARRRPRRQPVLPYGRLHRDALDAQGVAVQAAFERARFETRVSLHRLKG